MTTKILDQTIMLADRHITIQAIDIKQFELGPVAGAKKIWQHGTDFCYNETMNKKAVLLILTIFALAITGAISRQVKQADSLKNTPAFTKTPEINDFTASFEIFTNGTKRIFTSAMYHSQSSDVFIQSADPSIIYVKKAGITWADFFATLPFSINKTCLVTGTKETYCSNGNNKLRFFINGLEKPDTLDLKIQPGEALRITYGDGTISD